MTDRRVAVVIPTLNAGRDFDAVLAAIRDRSGCEPKIIAIDSGSTDGTIGRLQRAGATILSVGSDGFNHGATRNQALAQADGEFAVLMVQDALPLSEGWLSELLEPLLADPGTAGTFARQQPAANASRVTAYYLDGWVASQDLPRTSGPLTRELFAAMSPAERHRTCAFDNVCSCIRLSVWRDHPFPSTSIAEDLEWARDVLLAGHTLTYVPQCVVRHSHERSARYELQRAYLVHQRLETLFGLTTIPTLGSLVRSIATTVPHNTRLAAREPAGRARAMLRAAALGVAQPFGQYLGARAARDGRQYLRPRGI
jgi:rhamnosyltransferase